MFGDNPRKLSDILNGESREELSRRFDEVDAAPDFAPVPTGTYEVDFVSGELCQSQKGGGKRLVTVGSGGTCLESRGAGP